MSEVKKRRSGGTTGANTESGIAKPSAKPTRTVPIYGIHYFYSRGWAFVFLAVAVAVAVCAAVPSLRGAINFFTNPNEPERTLMNKERQTALAFYFWDTIADWSTDHVGKHSAVEIISGEIYDRTVAQERIQMFQREFAKLSQKHKLFIVENYNHYENTKRYNQLLENVDVDLMKYFVSVTAWKGTLTTHLEKINKIITDNNLEKANFYLIAHLLPTINFLKKNDFNVIEVNHLIKSLDFEKIERIVK